jgi:hypothetical protein
VNAQIAAYEQRLRKGARLLEKLEAAGRIDGLYERTLRQWLALLAAYEYESEVVEAGREVALAVGV